MNISVRNGKWAMRFLIYRDETIVTDQPSLKIIFFFFISFQFPLGFFLRSNFYLFNDPNVPVQFYFPWLTFNPDTKYCISLYYYMFGPDPGHLIIYHDQNSALRRWPIWSRSGSFGPEWHHALVEINSGPGMVMYLLISQI